MNAEKEGSVLQDRKHPREEDVTPPAKRQKAPARITSAIEKGSDNTVAALDLDPQLSPSKSKIYAGLRAYLERLSMAKSALRGDARRRLGKCALEALASIALLFVIDESMLERFKGDGRDDRRIHMFETLYGNNGVGLLDNWVTTKARSKREQSREPTSEAGKTVGAWYDDTCMVTGSTGPGMSAWQIVPHFVPENDFFVENSWVSLLLLYPDEHVERVEEPLKKLPGEARNLLILDESARVLLDRGGLGRRPLDGADGCELDPQSMRLQLVHVSRAPAPKLIEYGSGSQPIVDSRGTRGEEPESIPRGSVVRLTTADSEKYPLPSRDLLQIRWDLDRALLVASSPDLLRIFFQRDVRPTGGNGEEFVSPLASECCAGSLSRYLIARATEEGIIRPKEVHRWRDYLIPRYDDDPEADEDDLFGLPPRLPLAPESDEWDESGCGLESDIPHCDTCSCSRGLMSRS